MHRTSRVVLALGILAAAMVPTATTSANPDESPYQIPPDQLAKLEREALLGDAKAAHRLLSRVALSSAAVDSKETTFWLTVAAENGHPLAQYYLGAMLLGRADRRDQVRAEYWLARAAKAGDESAARLLKRIRRGELPRATQPASR